MLSSLTKCSFVVIGKSYYAVSKICLNILCLTISSKPIAALLDNLTYNTLSCQTFKKEESNNMVLPYFPLEAPSHGCIQCFHEFWILLQVHVVSYRLLKLHIYPHISTNSIKEPNNTHNAITLNQTALNFFVTDHSGHQHPTDSSSLISLCFDEIRGKTEVQILNRRQHRMNRLLCRLWLTVLFQWLISQWV